MPLSFLKPPQLQIKSKTPWWGMLGSAGFDPAFPFSTISHCYTYIHTNSRHQPAFGSSLCLANTPHLSGFASSRKHSLTPTPLVSTPLKSYPYASVSYASLCPHHPGKLCSLGTGSGIGSLCLAMR